MKSYRLTVAYDGTDFHGFQRQPGGLPTIQSELEQAASSLFGEPVALTGSGRTDAGVHARGQCVSFKAQTRIPVDRLPYAFNAHLPPTIVVTGACEVDEGFCARRSARGKVYSYTIQTGPFPCPLWRGFSWHHPQPLELELMRDAAGLFVGTQDFVAFSRTGSSARTTVRTITGLDVTEERELVRIVVCAGGFLYGMVRLIAGTLAAVGTGAMDAGSVRTALADGRRGTVGATAPARGLCLERVLY